MILVDSSVRIEHFRRGDTHLVHLMGSSQKSTPPFVIGELACGHLQARRAVLESLAGLPLEKQASDHEALRYLERQQLMGRGIGYIDVHLLAATALGGGTRLWTRDKRLRAIAVELGLGYEEPRH